jgi:hypothetical protein
MNALMIATTAATAALMTLGCGAPEPVTVAGLPTDYKGPGVYTVPGAPAAAFDLPGVRIEQTGGMVSVYYDLPADLVGTAQSVELTGAVDATGALQLAGDAGTSTCTVSPAALDCDERLVGVHVDAAQASAQLPVGDPRRAAVQAFTDDPIGILHVALPAAAGPGHH